MFVKSYDMYINLGLIEKITVEPIKGSGWGICLTTPAYNGKEERNYLFNGMIFDTKDEAQQHLDSMMRLMRISAYK